MSRFNDDGDYEGPISYEMFERQRYFAVRSKRGRKYLERVKAAMLALPERKLIDSALARDGMACVIGAFYAGEQAKERGVSIQDVIAELSHTYAEQAEEDDPEYLDSEEYNQTIAVATAYGMTKTLAWVLSYLNDEGAPSMPNSKRTPEWRWQYVMDRIERWLALPPLTREDFTGYVSVL